MRTEDVKIERKRKAAALKKMEEEEEEDASSSEAEDDSEEDGSEEESEEESDEDEEMKDESGAEEESDSEEEEAEVPAVATKASRKRRHDEDGADIEGAYMSKLADEEKEHKKAKELRAKRRKTEDGAAEVSASEQDSDDSDAESDTSEIPQHESLAPSTTDSAIERSNRTVFLGNVSTEAIKSKSAKKTLTRHLTSFFPSVDAKSKDTDKTTKPKLESLRFRSTAYASLGVPKRASFTRKELMDSTTKSTNAYAVYSTTALARKAMLLLNGTVVLDRHLRVDSVAHPAPIDHKRCIFVGNLGFVDDESALSESEDEEGNKKKKKSKPPSDTEEGLWRFFNTKVGPVESVRVIRDKDTRVGKGFAYVQFKDDVAIEEALQLDGEKFPPMLPRKLRITRARKQNKKKSSKEDSRPDQKAGGKFAQKQTEQQRSLQGRAVKMLGNADAATFRNGGPRPDRPQRKERTEFRKPEDFVFEGFRARAGEGPAIRMKGQKKDKKSGGKPKTRSARRGAAFRAAGGKK